MSKYGVEAFSKTPSGNGLWWMPFFSSASVL